MWLQLGHRRGQMPRQQKIETRIQGDNIEDGRGRSPPIDPRKAEMLPDPTSELTGLNSERHQKGAKALSNCLGFGLGVFLRRSLCT